MKSYLEQAAPLLMKVIIISGIIFQIIKVNKPEDYKSLFEGLVVILFLIFFCLGNKLITINFVISLWNH